MRIVYETNHAAVRGRYKNALILDASIGGTYLYDSQGTFTILTKTPTIADVTGLAAALALKAPLLSPAFTGTPTAPTAAPGTNTTQLATTAFVTAGITAATPLATFDIAGKVRQVEYDVHDFGAKGDDRVVTDAGMTNGSGILTSASAAFTSADVGKQAGIAGAGAAGVTLFTTIASYQSATQVTLATPASTTVVAATFEYGTNDTPAIRSAMYAAITGGGIVRLQNKTYLMNSSGGLTPAVNGNSAATKTVIFKGAGMFGTTLKAFGNTRGGIFNYSIPGSGFPALAQVICEDLTLDGNYINVGNGLLVQNLTGGSAGQLVSLPNPFVSASGSVLTGFYHYFSRVRFYRPAGFGIQGFTGVLTECVFDKCGQPDVDQAGLHWDNIGNGGQVDAIVSNCTWVDSSGNYADFITGSPNTPLRVSFIGNKSFNHQIGGVYACGQGSIIIGNTLRNNYTGSYIGYDASTDEDSRGNNIVANNTLVNIKVNNGSLQPAHGDRAYGNTAQDVPNGVVITPPIPNANISGTSVTNNSTTLVGVGTHFTTQVMVGDRIALSSASGTFATVTAIASDTSLTLSSALGNGTTQNIARRAQIFQLMDTSLATKVMVNDQGYVGVGTILPQSSLHVVTPDNTPIVIASSLNAQNAATGILFRYANGVSTANIGSIIAKLVATNVQSFIFNLAAPGTNTLTEYMRLTNAGNLGIGISPANGVTLDVNGIINVNTNRITSVAAPTASTDAANKAYVDARTVIQAATTSNGVRITGPTSSASTNAFTLPGASLTAADIGKSICFYGDFAGGKVTTIASVTSSTTGTVAAANSGITLSGTGYAIYGTNDSAAIQAALNAAALAYQSTITFSGASPNTMLSTGLIEVVIPNGTPHSISVITSQIDVPSGVILNARATIANMLPSRDAFCFFFEPNTRINNLEIENLFGTGVDMGYEFGQANIDIRTLRVWHTGDSSTTPTSFVGTPSTSGGTLSADTRYFVLTAIDAYGGETPISSEISVVTTGATSSIGFTWTNPAGTASNRLYVGDATKREKQYINIPGAATSYSLTASTSGWYYRFPVGGGTGLRTSGYGYDTDLVFIKTASQQGWYFNNGGDLKSTGRNFIIGCRNGVRLCGSNQVEFGHIFLDTCGLSSVTGTYGVLVESGCSDVSGDIQAFTVVGQTTALEYIFATGIHQNFQSSNIVFDVQGNCTGGKGIFIQSVSDTKVRYQLSNTTSSSVANLPITTAVVYGSGNAGYCDVEGVMSSTITPTSGTVFGTHRYKLGTEAVTLQALKIGPTSVAGNVLTFSDALGNVGSTPLSSLGYLSKGTDFTTGQTIIGNGYAAQTAGAAGSYVRVTSAAAIQLGATGSPFSIAFKTKLDSPFTFTGGKILAAIISRFQITVAASQRIQAFVTGTSTINGTAPINAGETHDITLTWDGVNTLILYVDGVQDGTTTGTSTATGTNDLYIGQRNGATGQEYPGQFDNYRMYNRVLTPTEVSNLALNGTAPSSTGLVLELGFDGQSTVDTSPSALTVTNASVTYTTGIAFPLGDSSSGIYSYKAIRSVAPIYAATAAQGTNTTQLATTAMVQSEVTLLAPKASPTFTGTPAAPTAAPGTNTTQLATTAFVAAATAVSTPPGGSTKQVQFNNAGAFGGSADLTFDDSINTLALPGTDTGFEMAGITTEPAAPAASTLRLYSKSIAGKMFPKTKGPAGISTELQNALWKSNITQWYSTGVTAGLWIGTVGAGAGAIVVGFGGTSSIYASMKRTKWANVVTTLDQVLGQRNTEAMYIASPNVAGLGGFFFHARCGFDTWTNGGRFFAGFHSATTVVSSDPSSLNNTVGFCIDVADNGAISFLTRGTSATKASTGFTAVSGKGYDVYIYCAPGTSTYYWRIVDINAATEASGIATLNPPAANTGLCVGVLASNAALTTVNSIILGLNRIYVETDY